MREKDKTVRGAFRNKHLFLEFIRKYIPQLKNINISEENLEWIDPNTITPDLSEKSGDVFYKLYINREEIYVYVSLEHKSSVEYDTVIQTMFYTFRIWEQEYKKAGKKQYVHFGFTAVSQRKSRQQMNNLCANEQLREKT